MDKANWPLQAGLPFFFYAPSALGVLINPLDSLE